MLDGDSGDIFDVIEIIKRVLRGWMTNIEVKKIIFIITLLLLSISTFNYFEYLHYEDKFQNYETMALQWIIEEEKDFTKHYQLMLIASSFSIESRQNFVSSIFYFILSLFVALSNFMFNNKKNKF